MRIYLLLVAMCLGGLAHGQFTSQKVLIEVGTGTWCPACPIAVAMIDKMQEQGFEIAVVKYHNNDPYENEASIYRNSYYHITSFPTIIVDGEQLTAFNNYPQLESLYFTAAETEREYKIELTGNWSQENAVEVQAIISKSNETSSISHRFFLAVTESKIPLVWHGQTEVNYAERLLLPEKEGMELDFGDKDKVIHAFSFSINNEWDADNLEFTGFIQDTETKAIKQTASFTSNQVGIEEHTVAKQVSVFPNPAKDYIFMDTEESLPLEVSLYNIFGQQVLHLTNTEGKIDVSHLKSGLYLLQGVHENRFFSEKIILKK